MRFGIKLAAGIITIITITLSVSRFVMVRQNFLYAIEKISQKNMIQRTMERYSLERSILNDMEERNRSKL